MTNTMKRIFDGMLNSHTVRVIAEVSPSGNSYRAIVDGARIGGASSDRMTLAEGIELGKELALKFLRSTGQLDGEERDAEVPEEGADDAEEVLTAAAAGR
ncbi:hypothetical protein ABIA71_001934 [Stenotrophomonas sp. 2619]|uniref:hypothetical protein n=1 Tax=Stenotrophomonas sp. 2619 TaxID=3156316 RepID=UPI003393CAD3